MWKVILKTTLLAGTLDITAACTNAYFTAGTTPDAVLKYIASGALGKSATSGGVEIMALGLLFHFMIALACTVCFFWLYPKWNFLKKSVWLNSLLIGLIAWIITTQMIIPLSQIHPPPFNSLKAIRAILILVICIGLPIANNAKLFFRKNH
jgi:uncharacterized membrane protein YagU involved in acid resistance